MNALDNLADGFLDALEADFENIASTTFRDGKMVETPGAELAQISDWSGLVGSLPKSPSFPEVPNSEHNFPRPSSRQKTTRALISREGGEQGQGNAPGGGPVVHMPVRSKKQSQAPIGWTYKKGWANRPRASTIDDEKLTSEMQVRANVLQKKRDLNARNNLMGKGKGANFSHPESTRLRPKGFGSADLNRLKLVVVDVSAGRTPGPRYIVDPQPSRQQLKDKRHRKGKIFPNSNLATGKSKTMGMRIEAAGSTMSMEMPSLGSFERVSTAAESAEMLVKHGKVPLSTIPGPRIDTSGRNEYGSIYYNEMQSGGPGPAYDVNDGFLQTSSIIRAERPTFSPANSRPSSPEAGSTSSLQPSRHDRKNRK